MCFSYHSQTLILLNCKSLKTLFVRLFCSAVMSDCDIIDHCRANHCHVYMSYFSQCEILNKDCDLCECHNLLYYLLNNSDQIRFSLKFKVHLQTQNSDTFTESDLHFLYYNSQICVVHSWLPYKVNQLILFKEEWCFMLFCIL